LVMEADATGPAPNHQAQRGALPAPTARPESSARR
jgi:hypothetical protein